MFEVTPDEIASLDDTSLRELVARLCEADAVASGYSTSSVTWGGSQTAPDGGLDVRVAAPDWAIVNGFIPRHNTGFQVKKQDMPRGAIIDEMKPNGVLRDVIIELAEQDGSYIIVSSQGSVADRALGSRRSAMREALAELEISDRLHTDFYDRTRLATWARRHSGVTAWVKSKTGREIVGWRPYGSWSYSAESVDADYLVDDTNRLHLGSHRETEGRPVLDCIDELRELVRKPGASVRLVGLSGVGKTRLVQALFDARIGAEALPQSLAVYADLSDDPSPQPVAMATHLLAEGLRAILIIDNCPPDLHRRLADLCSKPGSTVSIFTVEYDIRDDQFEGTQVVSLEDSSAALIEKLVSRRYEHVSDVDCRTIADWSGGNARLAFALAATVKAGEGITGLSDDVLFQRLFRQRHEADDTLLRPAKACSLVYSFQGEALTGDDSELPALAALAGQTPAETFRHVSELLRRKLVQRRGVWRAVLPHAIANRLAGYALEEIPYEVLDKLVVSGGSNRLCRSFSRRLSYLHDNASAAAIVRDWLAPGGLLGNLSHLNDLGRTMLSNVAPVRPEETLAALERVVDEDNEESARVLCNHLRLIRSLAYDARLFDRCTALMVHALVGEEHRESKSLKEVFSSLFQIYLSGTHATIEQRLAVIERLLLASSPDEVQLGVEALHSALQSEHFTSSQLFDFGARSRDYGYQPKSRKEFSEWFRATLSLAQKMMVLNEHLRSEMRGLIAWQFRGLWTSAGMTDELEKLSHQIASDGFWRDGWVACRQTIRYDSKGMPPDILARLRSLEEELRPTNLIERVQAIALGDRPGALDLDMDEDDNDGDVVHGYEKYEAFAQELGEAVAADPDVLATLLPDLLRGGGRIWSFGRGLMAGSSDPTATWHTLAGDLPLLPEKDRNVRVLMGFLSELWKRDQGLAHKLLDEALDAPALAAFTPALHSAVAIDHRCVERLRTALAKGLSPLWMYQNLAYGRTTDELSGDSLRELLDAIADQPEGVDVALHILSMRFFTDRSDDRPHAPESIEAGQVLLQRLTYKKNDQNLDYEVAGVARACLAMPDAREAATVVVRRLKDAIRRYETYGLQNDDLVSALLETQPNAVLDEIFAGQSDESDEVLHMFDHFDDRKNPVDSVPTVALIEWCDVDPANRYPQAASVVSFAGPAKEGEPKVWSEPAKALLDRAPAPQDVLAIFVNRFQPMSWSGSRSDIIEANAKLLDELGPTATDDLVLAAADAKRQLKEAAAHDRKWEEEREESRGERFE